MEKIEAGRTFVGLLVDGVDGTPYVGATLYLNPDLGVMVDVPWKEGDSQFTAVSSWFRGGVVPSTLVFRSQAANFTLFNVGVHGWSSTMGVAEGKLIVDEAVQGMRHRGVPFDAPLATGRLSSQLKGLFEWTRVGASTWEPEADDLGRVQKLTGVIEAATRLEWTQGDAQMTLSSSWASTAERRQGLHVDEWTFLSSQFSTPKSVSDHLTEHLKFRAFMVFMVGNPVPFERHYLSDDAFAQLDEDGEIRFRQTHDVVAFRTMRDLGVPSPFKDRHLRLTAHFNMVGVAGLQRWGECHEAWSRFIYPAAALLSRESVIGEDRVVALAMSLEAAGKIIGPVEGEDVTYNGKKKPTTATWFYRCFTFIGLESGAMADSRQGLARASARNYNAIKHFDGESDFPPVEQTYFIGDLLELTARHVALKVAVPDIAIEAVGSRLMVELVLDVVHNGLHITDEGNWEHIPMG